MNKILKIVLIIFTFFSFCFVFSKKVSALTCGPDTCDPGCCGLTCYADGGDDGVQGSCSLTACSWDPDWGGEGQGACVQDCVPSFSCKTGWSGSPPTSGDYDTATRICKSCENYSKSCYKPKGNCDNTDCEKSVDAENVCDGQAHGSCSSTQKRTKIVKRYWWNGSACVWERECYNVSDVCENCPPPPSITPTPTPTQVPSITPTPTPTPIPCGQVCDLPGSGCDTGTGRCARNFCQSPSVCLGRDVAFICQKQECVGQMDVCNCSLVTPTPTPVPPVCIYIQARHCSTGPETETCRVLTQADLNRLQKNEVINFVLNYSGTIQNAEFNVKKDGTLLTPVILFPSHSLSSLRTTGWNYTIPDYGIFEFQVRIQDINDVWYPSSRF